VVFKERILDSMHYETDDAQKSKEKRICLGNSWYDSTVPHNDTGIPGYTTNTVKGHPRGIPSPRAAMKRTEDDASETREQIG
jgi:hypothetical protein